MPATASVVCVRLNPGEFALAQSNRWGIDIQSKNFDSNARMPWVPVRTLFRFLALFLLLPFLTDFASALGANAVTVSVGGPVVTWSTSQDILLNVIVTAANSSSTPSGTVQILENGTPVGSPVPLGPGSAGYAATATTISITTPGNYAITASYSGDATFAAATSGVAFPLQILTSLSTMQLVPSPSTLTFAAGATTGNSVAVTFIPINGFHGSTQFLTSFAPDLGSPAPGAAAAMSFTGSYDVNGNYIETITINSTPPHLSSSNRFGSGMLAGKHNLIACACLLLLVPFTRRHNACWRFFVLVLGMTSLSALTACSGGTSPSPVQHENSGSAGAYTAMITGQAEDLNTGETTMFTVKIPVTIQ